MSALQIAGAVLSGLMFLSLLAVLACFAKDLLSCISRRMGTNKTKLRDLEVNSSENKESNESKLRELERMIRGMDQYGPHFQTRSPARARSPTMPPNRHYKRNPRLPLPVGTHAKWFTGTRQRERSLRTDLLRHRHMMKNGGAGLPPQPIPGAWYPNTLGQSGNTPNNRECNYASRPNGPRPMPALSTPTTEKPSDVPVVTLSEPRPILSPNAITNAILTLQEQCDDADALYSCDESVTDEKVDEYIPTSVIILEEVPAATNTLETESRPVLDVSCLLVPSDSWESRESNNSKESIAVSDSDKDSNSDNDSDISLPLPVLSPSSSPKKSVLKSASSSFKDFRGLTAAAAKSVAKTPRKVLNGVQNLARYSPKKESPAVNADKENMV